MISESEPCQRQLGGCTAMPNGDELRRIARSARTSASDDASPTEYVLAGWKAAMLAASPTPPAEQPEDEGISREQWIDQAVRVYLIAGDTEDQALECAAYLWGELDMDDLADPYDAAMSDIEGRGPVPQAAPKAAPGEPDPADIIAGALQISRGHAIEMMREALETAPQQEAQEPVVAAVFDEQLGRPMLVEGAPMLRHGQLLYTAPQPAPAPLSEMPYEKRKAIQEGEQIGASDAWFKARHEMLDTVDRRNVFRAGFDRGWNAALAAQGENT